MMGLALFVGKFTLALSLIAAMALLGAAGLIVFLSLATRREVAMGQSFYGTSDP